MLLQRFSMHIIIYYQWHNDTHIYIYIYIYIYVECTATHCPAHCHTLPHASIHCHAHCRTDCHCHTLPHCCTAAHFHTATHALPHCHTRTATHRFTSYLNRFICDHPKPLLVTYHLVNCVLFVYKLAKVHDNRVPGCFEVVLGILSGFGNTLYSTM
jgi:hypothetical protein